MTETDAFRPYGKTPRLFRDCIITEKLDGTNSQLAFLPWDETAPEAAPLDVLVDDRDPDYRRHQYFLVYAGSRNRLIYPGKTTDNYGFAAWARERAMDLFLALGPGRHYGEWYGQGIARGYGLDGKRWALFGPSGPRADYFYGGDDVHAAPVLYEGPFSTGAVAEALEDLRSNGSAAAPGFMSPEGVITFHTASRQVYKTLLENDDTPKGMAAA